MTDEEIIKALKGNILNAKSIDCKVWSIEVYKLENALDLINRQQAEIEMLKKENEILSINADTAFQDGLNEAQDLYASQIKNEIKSEAVKEFVERFEKKIKDVEFTLGQSCEIQNALKDTLKEMVGE